LAKNVQDAGDSSRRSLPKGAEEKGGALAPTQGAREFVTVTREYGHPIPPVKYGDFQLGCRRGLEARLSVQFWHTTCSQTSKKSQNKT
jgi:hypothetical protein